MPSNPVATPEKRTGKGANTGPRNEGECPESGEGASEEGVVTLDEDPPTPIEVLAAKRYFATWRAQGEALKKRHRSFWDEYPGEIDPTCITDREDTNSVLVEALFSIAMTIEAGSIASMSRVEIRKIPPVLVYDIARLRGPDDDDKKYLPEDICVEVLGSGRTYHVFSDCAESPKVMKALDKLCASSPPAPGKPSLTIVGPSRAFARVFWDWYKMNPKSQASSDALPYRKPLPDGPYGAAPNELIDRTVKRAIWDQGKNLKPLKSGRKRFEHTEGNSRATVSYVPPAPVDSENIPSPRDSAEIPPTEAEMNKMVEETVSFFKSLDELTHDTFQIAAMYRRKFKDKQGSFHLWAEDVLDERGVARKLYSEDGQTYKSGHRSGDIADIARCIEQLRSFKMTVGTIIKPGARRNKVRTRKGYLLIVEQEFANPVSGKAEGWKLRFYDGLEDLVQDNRFGNVYRKQFQWHLVNRKIERRLSSFIYDGFRLNHNRRFNRQVGDVMDALNLPFDKQNPQRSIDRFVEGLKRLVEDDGIEDFGFEIAKDVIIKEVLGLKLPARNLKEAFRGLKLWFYPPATLPQIKDNRKKLSGDK
jgi:hypothetical protein